MGLLVFLRRAVGSTFHCLFSVYVSWDLIRELLIEPFLQKCLTSAKYLRFQMSQFLLFNGEHASGGTYQEDFYA
jgi:hypothetical protein